MLGLALKKEGLNKAIKMLIGVISSIIIYVKILERIGRKKIVQEREKVSNYECGILSTAEIKEEGEISNKYIRYYKIGIMYILFDIEIILLLGIIKEFSIVREREYIVIAVIIYILLYGVYIEIKNNIDFPQC